MYLGIWNFSLVTDQSLPSSPSLPGELMSLSGSSKGRPAVLAATQARRSPSTNEWPPLPVDGIEHFDCNQHRQSHCHRFGVIKDMAVNVGEHPRLSQALHMMSLGREKVGTKLTQQEEYSKLAPHWNVTPKRCQLHE